MQQHATKGLFVTPHTSWLLFWHLSLHGNLIWNNERLGLTQLPIEERIDKVLFACPHVASLFLTYQCLPNTCQWVSLSSHCLSFPGAKRESNRALQDHCRGEPWCNGFRNMLWKPGFHSMARYGKSMASLWQVWYVVGLLLCFPPLSFCRGLWQLHEVTFGWPSFGHENQFCTK